MIVLFYSPLNHHRALDIPPVTVPKVPNPEEYAAPEWGPIIARTLACSLYHPSVPFTLPRTHLPILFRIIPCARCIGTSCSYMICDPVCKPRSSFLPPQLIGMYPVSSALTAWLRIDCLITYSLSRHAISRRGYPPLCSVVQIYSRPWSLPLPPFCLLICALVLWRRM